MFDLLCTCIVSCLFLCSYVVLLPLVTNCIVNSLENERNWWLVNSLDINSVDCWRPVHVYSSYCSFTTDHHHGSIHGASIKEGSQTGRLGCWGAALSSFTSGSIQATLQKKPNMQLDSLLDGHQDWNTMMNEEKARLQRHTEAGHACLSRNKMIRCTLVGLWLTLNGRERGDWAFIHMQRRRACGVLVWNQATWGSDGGSFGKIITWLRRKLSF